MRKLNLREWHLVQEALKAQRDETVKIIQEAEKDPKKGRPLFTTAFIQREHNDLIELLRSGVSKEALKIEKKFNNKSKSE